MSSRCQINSCLHIRADLHMLWKHLCLYGAGRTMDFHIVKHIIKLCPLNVFCAFAHNNHRLKKTTTKNPPPLFFRTPCRITDSFGTCFNSLLPPQWYVSLHPIYPVYSYVMAPTLNLISVNMYLNLHFLPLSSTHSWQMWVLNYL